MIGSDLPICPFSKSMSKKQFISLQHLQKEQVVQVYAFGIIPNTDRRLTKHVSNARNFYMYSNIKFIIFGIHIHRVSTVCCCHSSLFNYKYYCLYLHSIAEQLTRAILDWNVKILIYVTCHIIWIDIFLSSKNMI